MKVEVEYDLPDGQKDSGICLKLGPELEQLLSAAGLPVGTVLFIELQNDEQAS
jgi:hypothetical protein